MVVGLFVLASTWRKPVVGEPVMALTHSDPELRRFQIEHDLPHLHRERWNRIAAELTDQIEAATGDDRARLQHQFDRHYEDRFRSESSREALLAEAGIVERN
ncbi:hypothetical protein [Sphingomonas faeni]|nr:hypothetical protein [Sphingomonas faeni]